MSIKELFNFKRYLLPSYEITNEEICEAQKDIEKIRLLHETYPESKNMELFQRALHRAQETLSVAKRQGRI